MGDSLFRLDQLAAFIIQEADLFHGVIDQVKTVEREMRLMYAVLEHMEDLEGSSKIVEDLYDKTMAIARYVEDLLETFVIKKEQKRSNTFKWLHFIFTGWIDRYKFQKELNGIKVKIHDVFKKRKAYDTGNQVGERKVCEQTATVEENIVLLNSITNVSSAIQKVNNMLNLIVHPGVIKLVECMRDELTQTHSCLKNIEPAKELDERERVWVDDVRDICCLANDAFESFIKKREPWMKRWRPFKHLVLVFSDRKSRKKIEQIAMKFRDQYDRRWTYGIGEFEGSEVSRSRVRSIWQRRLSSSNYISSCWQSLDSQSESIRRDLRLIDALSKDVGDMENLDEREKVWLEQMLDVATEANVIHKYFCKAGQEKKVGVLKKIGNLRARWKDMRKIELINSKILDMSEKKWSYDIENLGRKRTVQNQQEMAPSTSDNVDINNLNETPPGSSQQYTTGKTDNSWIGDQFKSIREELKLMYALFEDFKAMKEPNKRMNVWVEEMRDVANDAKKFIFTHENKIPKKGGGIINSLVLICSDLRTQLKVKQEVYRIKSRISDISKRKMTYDIGGIKGRGQSSLAQNLQERTPATSFFFFDGTPPATSESIERGDSQNGAKRYIVKKMSSFSKGFIGGLSRSDLEGQVKWVENELEVIDALYKDVQAMEDQDRRLKIWLEEMRVVTRDVEWVVNYYTWKGREIRRIKNKIHAVYEKRLIYGIDFMKTGEASNSMIQSLGRRKPVSNNVEVRTIMASQLTDEESRVLGPLNQDQGPWKENFNMIYKDLPIYLQKCLDYFTLFPEDFEIPTRRLITLWVAEGFVNQKMVYKELPEKVAERYLLELIDWKMVQVTKKKFDGNVKKCRLPRDVRKLLLSKPKDVESPQDNTNTTSELSSRGQGFVHLSDHLNEEDASFKHIHGDNTNNSLQNYRNVLSFLSFDTQEGSKPGNDVGNFIHQCISSKCFLLLRVLDLERVFRPKLPKTIGKLSQLRYLGLRWTYLETLPLFISNLLKLQTLDVKHTYISTLPRSIWKMQQLRHLYLSESYRSRFVPRPSGDSLMDLQTLWGVFIDEKSPVRNGLDRLLNIKKLGLSCRRMSSQQKEMSSQLAAVSRWVEQLKHLQYLRLRSHDERGQPWDLYLWSLSDLAHLSSIYLLGRLKTPRAVSMLFPENLINLTLSASELNEDPMKPLGKLPKLKILQLLAASYIEKKMHCCSGGFPELQVLKLWKLENLEKWDVEDGALRNLRDLEIRSCRKLEALPDGLQHVKTLHELKLSKMPKEFTARIEKGKARIGMNCKVCIDD